MFIVHHGSDHNESIQRSHGSVVDRFCYPEWSIKGVQGGTGVWVPSFFISWYIIMVCSIFKLVYHGI